MTEENSASPRKIVLVGNPNVGKSVIFRLLTRRYAMVSNFPGTTVEIARGKMLLGDTEYEVIDTPGINSLIPQSEEERITCEILLTEDPDRIIQISDGKNLRRTLLITSQLAEFGIPMVLVLNMMDEAEERGIEIDSRGLSNLFAIPLVETVAIYRHGTGQLLQAVEKADVPQDPLRDRRWAQGSFADLNGHRGPFSLAIEWMAHGDRSVIREAEKSLGRGFTSELTRLFEKEPNHGSLASEIARRRNEFLDWAVESFRKKKTRKILEDSRDFRFQVWFALLACGILLFAWSELGGLFHSSTPFRHAMDYASRNWAGPFEQSFTSRGLSVLYSILFGKDSEGQLKYGIVPEIIHTLLILAPVIVPLAMLLRFRGFTEKLGILTRRPLTGVPILLGVLLLVYEFVGYTGAQTLVGLIEDVFFGQHLIPLLQSLTPPGFFFDVLLGKYGLLSMGLTYSIAIVFPVVVTFFLAFGILEDSGYLPRLTILSDRVMRWMGLNGKATLPLVLGLGCCTMATMTTRILSTRKERLIATLLLALGIPCSAQLGVILGIASGFSPSAMLTIIGVVISQLFLVGFLLSKLIRGERSGFIFEIPPIRIPQVKNLMLKTGYRVRWYLKEAVPLFLYGTLALFVLDKWRAGDRSLLEWMESGLSPVVSGVLHLPSQAASIFVLGFLRRDYGAAGLFEMVRSGTLSAQQAVVSLIVITLFVPCLATFLVIVKEHGLKWALAMTGFILPFAIFVGGVVSWILRTFEVTFR